MTNHLWTILSTILLFGCSQPSATGTFVTGDTSSVVKVELVETADGNLNGSVSVAQIDFANDEVKITSKSISGVVSDGKITAQILPNGWGAASHTLDMTLENDILTMTGSGSGQSLTLARSNQADYADRVNKLNKLFAIDRN